MSEPYTHAAHAARCRLAADSSVVLVQFVQVRMMDTSVCGRIVGAWTTDAGLDMWQLDLLGPIRGRQSIPARRSIQCSGIDGRCFCAGSDLVLSPGSSGPVFGPAGVEVLVTPQ